MNDKERAKFRASKEWQLFREKMKNIQEVDVITRKPLRKGWNLHHKDLNKDHYTDLNPKNFACLNKQSHDCLHFLYRYYCRDRDVLKRLKKVLDEMVLLNS